ncbi:MAG TPA: lysophospholipid acyltransferase family protein [Dissulfurispiraceae bacterium]|nr:lysophospholipid acyltransferase family protein [Dissulfurispiraceae bacterium]
MKRLLWLLELSAVLLVVFPLAFLPLRAGEVLGSIVHACWGRRRRIAVENVRRTIAADALPKHLDPEQIVQAFFRHLGRSVVELAKIYCGRGRRILESVELRGFEHIEKAKAGGKGLILLTGHCGNWELVALVYSLRYEPFAVVARAQNNPYLTRLVERIRKKFGNSVIYKKGALRNIVAELRKNRGVGLLMDQAVVPDEGYIINFLGRPAWTMKIPAALGRKTGTAIVPAFIHREGGRHVVTIHPPLVLSGEINDEQALRADTQRLSSFVEGYIREHPEQWLWIHRRWKRAGQEVR